MLVGWVANQSDGSVAVVAEGPAGALEALVAALREGPPGAAVSRVDVRHEPGLGTLASFEIRSGCSPRRLNPACYRWSGHAQGGSRCR